MKNFQCLKKNDEKFELRGRYVGYLEKLLEYCNIQFIFTVSGVYLTAIRCRSMYRFKAFWSFVFCITLKGDHR